MNHIDWQENFDQQIMLDERELDKLLSWGAGYGITDAHLMRDALIKAVAHSPPPQKLLSGILTIIREVRGGCQCERCGGVIDKCDCKGEQTYDMGKVQPLARLSKSA